MLCVNMMHFSSFITRTWMVGWPLKCPLIYVGKLTVSTQLIKKNLLCFTPLTLKWYLYFPNGCHFHSGTILTTGVYKAKKVQKYSEDTSSCF